MQQRLQEAKVKCSFIVSSNKLDKLIRLEKLTKEQNQIAKLLFTAAQAQPPQQWLVFPNKTRRHKLQAKVNALTWALFHTALANPNSVLRFNPKTKTWSFPTGLLQRFKLTKTFQHYFGNSPFQLKWNEISRIDPDFSAKNLAKAVLLERVNAIGIAVQFHSLNQLKPKIITLDSKIGRWKFTDNALKRLVRTRYLSKQALVGPDGKQLTLDDIARMEKGFTAENLARHVTRTRMENLAAFVTSFVPFKQLHFEQGNSPQKLPTKIPKHAFAVLGPHAKHEEDVWGRPIILWWEGAKRTKYDLVSAGSDGKFGTGDDLRVKPDSANAPPVLPWWREVAAVPKGHFVPNSSIYRNANVSLFKMANLPGFRSGSVLFNFSNNYYNYGNFNPISGHYQFGHQFGFTSHPIQLGNLHFGQIGFNIGFGNINPNFGRQGGCFGYCPRNGFGISMVGFNIGSGFNIGNGFGLGGMPRGNFNGYSRTFNTRGYAFGGFNIGGGFGIGGSPGLGRLSGQGAGHINGFEQGAPTPRIQFAPVFTAPKMAWAVSGPGKLKGNKAVPVPVRVRNFFPETMLWQPQIITDDKGEADMVINFADSITTWRLSASANSISGALGGTSKALKVFQDFFVDIDLPIALTQGDEIAIPVAVYNYLKKPQTVKIELLEQPWFSLLGNQQKVIIIKLQPNEVTSVKFHIRAHRAGSQSLTVKAAGSKKSDAVKRHVQVVPDGRLVESVINGYLDDRSEYTLAIPHNAVPGSYKHVVRIFPGVLSELIEGLEGMLRMPSGCFEQTSSSAYPNILIAEYLRKNRIASPKIMAKAEKYLNFGYQRLLTFEHHPNGGFSLYGRGEPSAWLTAYGLHEFHDMGKVWPVAPQVIQRSQKFLLDRRLRDGSWNVRYRPNRLAATCYITWALAESGVPKEKLKSSLDLIRNELKTNRTNTYTLALGANALAAVNDESTGKILHLLRRRANTANDKKAICFHAGESTLSRSQGLYATVETTALAILAFSRANLFAHDLPKLTNYLVQAKTSGGTWGTTSATVFALKALVAVRADSSPTKPVPYQIIVDGVPVAQGGITQENLDVMQLIDLHKNTQPGKQKFTIKVDGNTSATFQLTTRYYVPWAFPKIPANQKGLELQVSCNRLLLAPEQKVDIKAKIRNTGKGPAYNVMLDLGVPPGFEVEEREFEALVEKGKAKRFEVSGNRVILYLSTMRSGEFQTFEFSLRAKQSGRVQIPPSVAYEYYNPTNRATSGPVTFTVRKKD